MTTSTTTTTAPKTPKTPKTLKTLAAISSKLTELENQSSTLVRVLFKPVTHKIWINQSNYDDTNVVPVFCDMYGDQIPPAISASIILGKASDYRVSECSLGRVRLTLVVVDEDGDIEDYDDGGDNDCQIDVSPKHIAELTVLPGPKVVMVPGMTYALTLHNEEIEVYSRRLDKVGVLKVVTFLASNLGYCISPSNMTINMSTPARDPLTMAAPTTHTAPEAISAAVANLIASCRMYNVTQGRVLVKFKPITDSVWRRNEAIVDANSDGLNCRILPLILDGGLCEFKSYELSYGQVFLRNGSGQGVAITANHLQEFTTPAAMPAAPTLDMQDTLGYKIVWQAGNSLKVGCQTINAADDLLTVLAEYLGYKIIRATAT